MTPVWREHAALALERQLARIRRESPRAADLMERRVEERVRRLADFPYTGRPSRRLGVRELVISGTPFIAIYRVRGEIIEIIRFFHAAQKR